MDCKQRRSAYHDDDILQELVLTLTDSDEAWCARSNFIVMVVLYLLVYQIGEEKVPSLDCELEEK